VHRKAESNFFESFIKSVGCGHDGWIERTQDKLERGRKRFGDGAYLKIPLADMVEEVDEEAQDLGGWYCVITMGLHAKLSTNIIELDNPEYFENKSFTMAYSPILKNWISFYSFLPNYYIGHTTHFQTGNKSGLWNHLLTPFSHQVFYNKKYPYIIEYPINFLPNESQLNSVTIHQDIQKYYDKTNYYSISSLNKEDKINFNKAIIYNKEQTSGALNLIPKDPSNMRQKLQYPKTSSNGVDILCSFSEHKFTFNGFWDTVRNTNSNQPIFSSSWIDTKDSYPTDKVLNNSAIQYSTSYKRIPLKSKECRVRLINDTHTRYKFINHLLVTQTQKSIT